MAHDVPLPISMVRKALFRSSIYPYHVVVRSNNQDWFHLDIHDFWAILCEQAYIVSIAYQARIHGLVLMSNHFHLLLSTPANNLDQVMNYLLRETSRRVNFQSGRANHVFGGPYKWCLVHSALYYANAYKYVCRNPVRAKVCSNVEDYRFSTLSAIYGAGPLLFPIYRPHKDLLKLMPLSLETHLDWLNTSFDKPDDERLISQALKRREFEFPKRLNGELPSTSFALPDKVPDHFLKGRPYL